MSEPVLDGFLNVDKPRGMSSHDVVAKIRRLGKERARSVKAGHAGTLDPLATGVLVVCLGNATRLSEYVMSSKKVYRAVIHLGVVTDTYDAEGQVLREHPTEHVTCDDIARILQRFTGEIRQTPPMYSAIKQGGRKLYELARKGKVVEREPRKVTIDDLQIVEWANPLLTIHVVCGPGTYIRSLAHDIGDFLGTGGHLSSLTRLASGRFRLENALQLDDFMIDPNRWRHVIPPADALADRPSINLSPDQAEQIMVGRSIQKLDGICHSLVFAHMPDGHLLAVLRAEGSWWRPHKVFLPRN